MFRIRSVAFFLLAMLCGCSTVGTVKDYRRDSFRLANITWSNPKELRFQFADNAASFWLLDTKQSYLVRDHDEKLLLSVNRKDSDGIYFFVSRADGKPFKLGTYELHLFLDASFADYPKYKRRDTLTGAFTIELRHGLFMNRFKLQNHDG